MDTRLHDLRNRLSVMLGSIQLAAQLSDLYEIEAPQMRTYIQKCRQASDEVLALLSSREAVIHRLDPKSAVNSSCSGSAS